MGDPEETKEEEKTVAQPEAPESEEPKPLPNPPEVHPGYVPPGTGEQPSAA